MNWWRQTTSSAGSAGSDNSPYIIEIEGTALVGENSQIKIKGLNFTPDVQIVTNAGGVSNIQISPEQIIFNCLAVIPGSFPVEIKNGDLSSNDWNSLSTPVLIARNSLNITNGWLDFRSVDSTTLGNVTSHVNQSLSTKTFSNSGFSLNSSRGLIFNGTGATNSYNNYIQFNSFLFPPEASKLEIITISNSSNINRIRICTGLTSNINSIENAIDINSNTMNYSYRFGEQAISLCAANIRADYSFPSDSTNNVKFSWDFTTKLFSIYKLNGLSDLDSGDLKFKFSIDLFKNGTPSRLIPTGIIPLFQYFNSGSLSSVVSMKID